MPNPEDARQQAKADPVAWFAVMEHARRHNDFERAAHAKRELERLGVKVNYTRTAGLRADEQGAK